MSYAGGASEDAQNQPSDSHVIGQRYMLPEMPEDARAIRRKIEAAWKAYRGDWREHMPLKVERGDPDDNVLINRCAPIVDKGVSFLFGDCPKLDVMDETGDKAGPQAAQKALEDALGDEDDLMTTLTMLAMNGAVAGQTFAKLLPAEPGSGDGDSDDDDYAQYPRIVVQDPQNYWVITDPDDVNCPLAYVCEYDYDGPNGRKMTKRVTTEREDRKSPWTISTYIRERPMVDQKAGIISAGNDGGGSWTLIDFEEWPYDWCPIVDCMNLPNPNEYWGIADITPDLIHLNSVLNYVQSNINKIGRLHGTPFTYATNVDASAVSQTTGGPGKITCFPGDQVSVGAVQWAGDLANLMAYAGDLRSSMDEQSRVPAVALGRMADLPRVVSGVALEILYQPILEKTRLKRRLYGKLLRCLCEYILEMMSPAYEGLTVKVTWPNILPNDDQAAAQTAVFYQQVGVPQEKIWTVLGFDPDELEQMAKDAAQKALDAAAKGQGFPVPGQQQPPAPGGQGGAGGSNANTVNNGQPGQGQGANGQVPPTNHPAAVAQRNATKAVAQAMRSGAKIKAS